MAVESGTIGLGLFFFMLFPVFRKKGIGDENKKTFIFIGSRACMASVEKPLYRVNRLATKILTMVVILLVLWLEDYQIRRFTACIKWNKAETLSNIGKLSESALLY